MRWLLGISAVVICGLGALFAARCQAQQAVDDDTFHLQMVQGKLPTPQTLSDLATQVKRMRDVGASNATIAERMSRLIEQRLEATNKPGGESLFNPAKPGAVADRKARWQPLDDFMNGRDGLPGKPVNDGQRYTTIAQLAWDNRVGNCCESANVAYAALTQAGIPVRIFNSSSGGGHEFAVIGLAANADPNDPSTWGDDARVVDGWTGRSMTPDEALQNPHLFGGRRTSSDGNPIVSDQTTAYDDPAQQRVYQQFGTKGALAITVNDEAGKGVAGVRVRLVADEPQEAVTTGQGIANLRVYPGRVSVEATPPEGSHLDAGRGEATVQTRRIVALKIVLKKKSDAMITITAPADGAQLSDAALTVTGKVDDPNVQEVTVTVNGKATTAPVSAQAFSAAVTLSEGRNVLVATAAAQSSQVTVTMTPAPQVPQWNGRWHGTVRYTTVSDGEKKQHEATIDCETQQVGDVVRFVARAQGKKSATFTDLKITAASPFVAVFSLNTTFPDTPTSKGHQVKSTATMTLRDKRLYVNSLDESEYFERRDEKSPWVRHTRTSNGKGEFNPVP